MHPFTSHVPGFKLGLYSDAGTATCQNRAGSYGHEEQDAKTYAACLLPAAFLPPACRGGARPLDRMVDDRTGR